ncbi:MAG: hypothetical protein FJ143_08905 [Deltaproteobacteria bacterium]|nr:hypothetical protein [Deltaproteobacteria bacterium]
MVLFHYGDLAGGERDSLAAHVARCAGCAGYLRELATLMPLIVKTDDPAPPFWMNYNRELRQKLDAAVDNKSWWQSLASILRPRYLPAFASAAVVVLALTFTFGIGLWSGKSQAPDDELAELLPVAENLDFFSAMDLLDDLELLEFIGNQGKGAA